MRKCSYFRANECIFALLVVMNNKRCIYNFLKFAKEQMSIGVVCVACFQEKEKEKRIFLILLAYGLLHTFIVLFSAKKTPHFSLNRS